MRKNLKDDFEMMYLRSNIVLRDINKADPVVLKSRDFNKICMYMADRFMRKNSNALLRSGFDYPDVLNIVKVFGATYLGTNSDNEEKKNNKNYMMHHIKHRLDTFLKWAITKIDDSELTSDIYIDMYTNDHGTDLPLEIATLEDSIDKELSYRKKDLLEKKIAAKRKEQRDLRSLEIKISKTLRKKLNSAPMEFAEALVYYSNTPSVSCDMRKAARRYCDRFGIEYRKDFK